MAFVEKNYPTTPLPAPPPIEVEVDDDDVNFENALYGEDGSVTFGDPGTGDVLIEEHNMNLAEVLDDSTLAQISNDLLSRVEADLGSRSEWETIMSEGVNLLGFKYEETSQPFKGSCNVTHPLLAESVVKFQSRSSATLFPPEGPVKTKIVGAETPEVVQQAKRVKDYMNYQLSEEIPDYFPELERMLFHLPLFGSAFKKTYYDYSAEKPVSTFVEAKDFIVPYNTKDLKSAQMYTHRIKRHSNDLKRDQLSGLYLDTELSPYSLPSDEQQQETDRLHGIEPNSSEDIFELYEIHTYYDIEGFEDLDSGGEPTGLGLPYIITIDRGSGKVLSIYRNWNNNDPKRVKLEYFTHFPFIPGLGFYGYGFMHLIGGLVKTATSSIRQLVDAGTLSNLPGGYKSKAVKLASSEPIQPGEWRDINVHSNKISDMFFPLPYKEPSPTLYNLLEFMVGAAQKFADSTEQVISESTNYGPVGTTIALLEASGKMYTAIHKRLHFAQGQELKKIAALNGEFLPSEGYPYSIEGGDRTIFKGDFDGRVDVIPVSDPNVPSEAQRASKAQAALQIATQFPQEHNLREAITRMYDSLGIPDPQKLLTPLPPEAQTGDPVSENSWALKGMPIRAEMQQNHDAHIKVHSMLLQDELYTVNPQATAAMVSHIQDHLSHKMIVDMAQAIGVQIPEGQMDPALAEEIAVRAASMVDTLMQQNAEKDLGIGLQGDKKEHFYKLMELQMKDKHHAADLKFKYDQLALQTMQEAADQKSNQKIAQMQMAQKAKENKGA